MHNKTQNLLKMHFIFIKNPEKYIMVSTKILSSTTAFNIYNKQKTTILNDSLIIFQNVIVFDQINAVLVSISH